MCFVLVVCTFTFTCNLWLRFVCYVADVLVRILQLKQNGSYRLHVLNEIHVTQARIMKLKELHEMNKEIMKVALVQIPDFKQTHAYSHVNADQVQNYSVVTLEKILIAAHAFKQELICRHFYMLNQLKQQLKKQFH